LYKSSLLWKLDLLKYMHLCRLVVCLIASIYGSGPGRNWSFQCIGIWASSWSTR